MVELSSTAFATATIMSVQQSQPRIRKVLKHILLDLLSRHPDGVGTQLAYRLIEQGYRFPTSWYRPMPTTRGYSDLKTRGVTEWEALGPDALRELIDTEPNWRNNLRHERRDFKDAGWLDPISDRGMWRLSALGTEAAHSKDLHELTVEERAIVYQQAYLDQIAHQVDGELGDKSKVTIERTLRSVVLRRGQPAFRNALLEAYEGTCAISSCDAIAALEAAHVIPVALRGETACSNGLLLRADLHTLFDLDLLGIEPSNRSVVLAASLSNTSYRELVGVRLRAPVHAEPPRDNALQVRWAMFLARESGR
ncbi:MAG TPA: HNH endonuclease [Kofleriaceae bacterium]